MKKLTTNVANTERVVKLLKKITNKAKKYGYSLDYTISESYMHEVEVTCLDDMGNPTDETVKYFEELVDVTFNQEDLNFLLIDGDYELVARKENTDLGIFVKIINADYRHMLEEFKNTPICCQHCNTKRTRKASYVLLNRETKELIEVGKTCLADYLHSLDVMHKIAIYETVEELNFNGLEGGAGMRVNPYLSCEKIASFLLMVLDRHEFVKSADGTKDNPSTANRVGTVLDNYNGMDWFYFKRVEGYDLTEEHKEKAKEMIDKVVGCTIPKIVNNDFSQKVIDLCRNGIIGERHIGTFVWIINIYNRILEEENKIEKLILDHSYYNGKVGDKIVDIEVEYINYFTFQTFYTYNGNTSFIHKFMDAEGHVFVWKTTKALAKIEKGHKVKLSGSIKEFSEFNNEKQTVVTRCKIK